MEKHFQGSDFIPIFQPHQPMEFDGQEYYFIPKIVWEMCVESYYKHRLREHETIDADTDESDQESSSASSTTDEKRKREEKQTPSRKELSIKDTTYSLILLGSSNFHNSQEICFLDTSNQSNVNFKLLRGYLNDQEKKISKTDEYSTSLKIGSSKTFNSKSRGVYKLVFELDLLLGYLVELSIATSWKGYAKNNSFRSLDITECKVRLIDL